MGTITINIKDEVEKEFRELVKSVHGTKKGDLGRALTEALQKWISDKKQDKIAQNALKLIELDFDFGKRRYKHRYELYER